MPILYAICVLGLILFGFEGVERFEVEHLLLLLLFGLVAGSARSQRDGLKRGTPVQLYTPVVTTPQIVTPQVMTPQLLTTTGSKVIVAEQPVVYSGQYKT